MAWRLTTAGCRRSSLKDLQSIVFWTLIAIFDKRDSDDMIGLLSVFQYPVGEDLTVGHVDNGGVVALSAFEFDMV